MAARRTFDQDMTQPPMLFEESGQPDQTYGGSIGVPAAPARRQMSAKDSPEMPMQRYIPPATMEILLREAAKRGQL